MGHGNQARARVDRRHHPIGGNSAAVRFKRSNLDTVQPLKVVPEEDIVRVLQLWTHDDIVSCFPGQAGGEQVEPLRNVFGERHLRTIGIDQRRERFAGAFSETDQFSLVAGPHHASFEIAVHRLPNGGREKPSHANVEIDLGLGPRARIVTYNEDARTKLQQLDEGKYEMVMGTLSMMCLRRTT